MTGMQYKVLTRNDAGEFAQELEELNDLGWVPYQSMYSTVVANKVQYHILLSRAYKKKVNTQTTSL